MKSIKDPVEEEEYWKKLAEDIISKSQEILMFIANKKPDLYNKQLKENLFMTQASMDNFIKRLKEEVK